MNGPVEIVLALVAVGYVLARRLMGEPAQGRRLLILPAALSLAGLSSTAAPQTPSAWAVLTVGIGVSVVIGAFRGASVAISDRDGVALVRYTWITVVLWVANIAIKFGVNAVFGDAGPHGGAPVGNSVMLALGLGMLAEGIVISYRAASGGHAVSWQPRRAPVDTAFEPSTPTNGSSAGAVADDCSYRQSGRPGAVPAECSHPWGSRPGFVLDNDRGDARRARRARRR